MTTGAASDRRNAAHGATRVITRRRDVAEDGVDALLDRVVDIGPAGPERRHLNNTLVGGEHMLVRVTLG